MFPKEIVEILVKYQNTNNKLLDNINNNLLSIIELLYSVNQDLADKIRELVLDKDTDNNVEEFIKDSKILRNYIKSIQILEINNTLSINTSIEVSNELTQPIIFDKKVYPYLVLDNICPFCNYKLSSHLIHYLRIVDNKSKDEDVMWHRCEVCKRLFVLDYDAEKFDFSNTNIILNRDYYNVVPQISIHSVIVLDNTLQCSSQHITKDLIAQLPGIDEEGNLSYYSVCASYCFTCERFTILKSEFNKIKDIVICKVIDKTYDSNNSCQDNLNITQEESILTYYGYNVQTKKNISDQQRQIILSSLIESKIMSRREVIDHINILIKRGSKIPSWVNATQKWKSDIDFVNSYKADDLPKIIFDNIILKYKK